MKSSIVRQRIVSLLLFLTLLATSFASPIEHDISDAPDPQSGPYNVFTADWQSALLGIITILAGIYFCFFGYRFFRVTVFVAGFCSFGNLSYIVLTNVGVANHTILVFVSIAIGLILGGLAAYFYKNGIYILGAFAGYSLALWILSFKAGGLISSQIGQIIFIVVLVNVCLVLSFFFERFILIVATSFLGAFLFILGVDIFVDTGYASVINALLSRSANVPQSDSWQVYAMLAATFVLFLIGLAVQYATSWRSIGVNYRPNVPSGSSGTEKTAGRSYWPWRKTTAGAERI